MPRTRRTMITLAVALLAAVALWIDAERPFDGVADTVVETVVRGDATTAASRSRAPSPAATLSEATLPRWSDDRPNVNLWHVFLGEINRRGEPTGFHSRPDGLDPPGARVAQLRDGPNNAGVYTAIVEIRDGERWKRKFSTFFPDALSANEVVQVILDAYRASPNPNAQPWEGPSGYGFRIQGYTSSRGGIATAFPLYTGTR